VRFSFKKAAAKRGGRPYSASFYRRINTLHTSDPVYKSFAPPGPPSPARIAL